MALLEIYRCPVLREIHFPFFHIGTAFQLTITISSLIVPFFICYRSGGFWLQDSIYIEQPQIRFLKQVYIELKGSNQISYAWSTYTDLNSQFSSNLIIPHMSIQQLDDNYDGIYDKLKLKFQIPIEDQINSLYILLLFSYQLKERMNLIMQTPLIIQFDIPNILGFCKYSMYGQLSLHQREPLLEGYMNTVYNVITLKIDPKYETWTLGSASYLDPLVLNLTLFYKPNKIWSHPNIFHMLWWGWIQYFPILLFSLYIGDRIKAFVYGHHLIHGFIMKYDRILYKQ
uniref:Transmembrane protein 231 n=1 Tax=Schistosoma mansoni TaxID=6183 RepID=A0A5K4F5Z9_SCHMA